MLTQKHINILDRICLGNWRETNNYVDINGSVNFDFLNLNYIFIQFGQVTGHFNCAFNNLTELKNAPNIILGAFSCDCNELTSLIGGPKEVNSIYSCSNNLLTTLIGAPQICNESFNCDQNQLTSLDGCPKIINYNLYCSGNLNLHILYGIGCVKHDVIYDHVNDLNEWIIQQARKNIFVSYTDIAKWIKCNAKYEFLLHAPQEIRQHFSKYTINMAELNLC